jgi:hypothetical protein
MLFEGSLALTVTAGRIPFVARQSERIVDLSTSPGSKSREQKETMLKTDTRQANWRRANPGKYEAHLAVQRAVKAGELDKESCEVCGVEAVDAHHDQYDEPLRVRWLCRRHHTRLHHYGEDMFPVRNPTGTSGTVAG